MRTASVAFPNFSDRIAKSRHVFRRWHEMISDFSVVRTDRLLVHVDDDAPFVSESCRCIYFIIYSFTGSPWLRKIMAAFAHILAALDGSKNIMALP